VSGQDAPLRRRLLILLAAAVLPLAAMAGLALLDRLREQSAQTERAGLEITRAMATAVDAELGRTIAVLQGIAVGPSLDAGDLRRYHEVIRRTLAARPEWITIRLNDASGRLLADAQEPFGAEPGPVVERSSLEQAVRSGRPAVGLLAKGPGGRFAVPVRVPVVRDGEVRYVVSAALKPDVFVEVLKRQQLPEDWVVSIFDRADQRVARSRRHDDFIGQPPSPSLLEMMRRPGLNEASGVTRALEGDEIYTAFSRSRETGWTVAIGIPTALIEAGAMRSLGAYGGGLVLSLAFGLLAALLALRAASAADQERAGLLRREQEARAAAEAANRAKDEFLAMLGHELRNPLGALANASQLLRHPRVDAEAARHARDIVARQVEHLARLTDDLLDAGRAMMGKIALERRPLELAAAVGAALGTLKASGRLAAHRVEERLEPVWVDADQTRIEQIVVNLVGNAAKYTPPGGRIAVRVGRDGDEALLSVSDDGAGMAPELLARVFEPFVQGPRELDRAQGGLGIGLTLVRRLADLHGGRAEARSAGPGRGSELRVHFPAIPAPAAASEPVERPAAAVRDVLVVEDNADAAETLQRLLELAGHRVRVARSGTAGLEELRRAPPDVALIDIGLPGMDGYELARRARGLDGKGSPILVALTGYGLPEDRSRALQAGFDEHLAKPVSPAALEALFARRHE
jgi:signal transduction histidine kinase